VLFVVVSALATFLVTRRLVNDQEDRLLRDRSRELSSVLTSSISSTDSSLRVLGDIGASDDPAASRTFSEAASPLLRSGVSTIGVAREDHGFTVVVAVGDGPLAGQLLEPERAGLAARALAAGELVSAVVVDGGTTTLVLARPAGSGQAVVYEESKLDPTRPVPSTPSSPYHELRVAVYASSSASPGSLVLTTEASPLRDDVVRAPFAVGADHWLLVVSPRGPLLGRFPRSAPWMLLIGGLVTALLAGATAEVLARRRAFALTMVAERTADLQEANAELAQARGAAERANAAKDEFLSRMSHELRTPLNAVLGFAQLLERDPLDEEQADSVRQILRGGRHLLALIDEVLDISRISTGNLALSSEPVAVAQAIGEAVALVRPLATERRVELGAEDADGLHVLADHQRLKQVLLNLLSNGVKYNHEGGSVRIGWERASISRLRIKVSDTGPGIPPEKVQRLFAPFDRLGAEASDVPGTGLGLALSRGLVQAMGGTLDVASRVGSGSTFTIELPLAETPVDRYERERSRQSGPTVADIGEHTVLYVEDNLSNLTLIERILDERPGIRLITAMLGGLGIELAQKHHPELILLDLHLPDLTGEEAVRRLRELPETQLIPIVMISADATPGQVKRLLGAGADDYLTKPVDLGRFLQVLDRFLPRKARTA
jgi:signal transduction histidine kinase/ActR/RegA family two-component response regulator